MSLSASPRCSTATPMTSIGMSARRLGTQVADDLMAETFVIAFQRRRHYDVTRPQARHWLYGIATKLIGQHNRAEARRFRALAGIAGPAPDEPLDEEVAARVSAQNLHRELARVLARLPARYRDVLLLVAWGDLDYSEAAEALGVPVGTVRSRLHRARQRVRESLGGVDPTATGQEHDHG